MEHIEHKEFTVIHGPRYRPLVETVELNGVSPEEPLTPSLASRAALAATGHRRNVTVWSTEDYGYRLYAKSHRKVQRDD